jgi:hypothetical protein
LEFIIKNQRPTVSLSELKKYEEIRNEIEGGSKGGINNGRNEIGFKR